MRESRFVVVVASGALGSIADEERAATVVAADGGLDAAYGLGLRPGLLVGDLDSVSPAALARAEAEGVRVERHPEEKDASDLELALDKAVALGADRIRVRLAAGGRLDHELAALLLLASERYASVTMEAQLGETGLHVIRGRRQLVGSPGDLLTLLAVNGPASGVRTHGLRYPLRGETLEPGSTRGLSNVFDESQAEIAVDAGVVIAVHTPGDSPARPAR